MPDPNESRDTIPQPQLISDIENSLNNRDPQSPEELSESGTFQQARDELAKAYYYAFEKLRADPDAKTTLSPNRAMRASGHIKTIVNPEETITIQICEPDSVIGKRKLSISHYQVINDPNQGTSSFHAKQISIDSNVSSVGWFIIKERNQNELNSPWHDYRPYNRGHERMSQEAIAAVNRTIGLIKRALPPTQP